MTDEELIEEAPDLTEGRRNEAPSILRHLITDLGASSQFARFGLKAQHALHIVSLGLSPFLLPGVFDVQDNAGRTPQQD